MLRTLHRHPRSNGGEGMCVEVDVARQHPGQLLFRYVVTGPVADLRLPSAAAPERSDELWRHTCFEAFVRAPDDDGYHEFNFAPSSRWAAYRFDGYRTGMAPAEAVAPPSVIGRLAAGNYELNVVLDLAGAANLAADLPWRAAVSAVLEDAEGRISYWALAHPPGKPDFHHLDGFILELPATEP